MPKRPTLPISEGKGRAFADPCGKEITTMQTILVSCLVAIVIAVGGAVVLDRIDRPAETAFATTSVRN